VNGREAARCGEWAQHFSNASCLYLLQLARAVSNRVFNEIMEATLDPHNKPIKTSNM